MSDPTDPRRCSCERVTKGDFIKTYPDPLCVVHADRSELLGRIVALTEAIATHERHLRGQGHQPRAFDLALWRTREEQT